MSNQLTPLDFVFPSELALIQGDAQGVVNDPQLGVVILYRSYQSRTFTPSTGAWSPAYADYPLRAIRNNLRAAEVAASQGLYRAGDVRYLLARADLAASPGTDDRLVEGTTLYDLVAVESDPLAAFWRIVARQVA